MEKITNVNIDFDNNTLSFTVESSTSNLTAFTVYMDECGNIDNIYADDAESHDYVFDFENSNITVSGNNVVIENTLIGKLDKHLKYIRLVASNRNIEGLYYTPAVIYNAELTHIKKVCATCLDNKCMQLIMYVTFKRQLLDSAIETGLNKDAMQLYVDICRMLEVSAGCKQCGECENNDSCTTCANGYCTLK